MAVKTSIWGDIGVHWDYEKVNQDSTGVLPDELLVCETWPLISGFSVIETSTGLVPSNVVVYHKSGTMALGIVTAEVYLDEGLPCWGQCESFHRVFAVYRGLPVMENPTMP